MDGHQTPSDTRNFVRIMFPLNRNEDGYPPVDSETMWAVTDRQGAYKLDNIPFYACGISFEDVVTADAEESGLLKFREVIEPSMHSTVRVVLMKNGTDARPMDERMAELRHKLEKIGCSTEANYPGFFAVDIPPSVTLSSVQGILSPGTKAGLWDYEEATLWHSLR